MIRKTLPVLVVIGIVFGVYSHINHHWVTFTVNKTERLGKSDSSRYLVYTDNGTYRITNSLFNGKFNSEDRYADILNGEKYTCDAVGFNIAAVSWHKNLIDCERWGQ